MKVLVDSVSTTLIDATQDAKCWFLCKDREYGWTMTFLQHDHFPTGLLHLFLQDFPTTIIEYTNTYTSRQITRQSYKIKSELRDYQNVCVSLTEKHDRGIFWMATNAGKTLCIAAIASMFSCPIIIVLYGLGLLKQTVKTLTFELNEKIGVVCGNVVDIDARVVVASIGKLSHISNVQGNVIIFDECHLASARTYLSCGNKSNARYRYGFSGTALLEKVFDDQFGLMKYSVRDVRLLGMIGPILLQHKNAQLIASGYSAKPIVHIYGIRLSREGFSCDYEALYLKHVIKNMKLQEKIVEIVSSCVGYVLILVTRLEHGRSLSNALKCRFVFSETIVEQRNYLPQERILVASTIFDLGLNLTIDHLILASGGRGDDAEGQNAVKLLQRIGRGLRKKECENVLHIHDFALFGVRCFERHIQERILTYEKESWEIKFEK